MKQDTSSNTQPVWEIVCIFNTVRQFPRPTFAVTETLLEIMMNLLPKRLGDTHQTNRLVVLRGLSKQVIQPIGNLRMIKYLNETFF
jgi:hypothetical protein